MKKKLFVVALMAALSTVGYAFEYTGDNTDAKFTETAKELTTLGKDLDRIYDDVGKHEQKFNDVNTALDQIYDEVGKDHAKLENNISKVENMEAELKDKADKDYVDGKVTELGDHVREEMDTVRGEISGVKAEAFENKENIAANKAEIENLKENKADKDYVDGKVTELGDHVREEMDTVRGEIGGVKAEVYENKENIAANKAEIENLKENKADKDYVDGKVTELGDHVREEMDTVRGEIGGVKAEVYENKEAIAANKTQIDKNTQDITTLQDKFAGHEGRISGLEKKVDNLDNKMNKGLSLMAAMNAVDFQNVETGEMALGAGIGHYGNAQSVALGVAYSPVEDLTVNAKYSVTAGSPDSFAVGAGATYKFKVGR